MTLQVVFHAPTAEALTRARRNLLNFRAAEPDARLRLIANGPAVPAALDNPDSETDPYLRVCLNTLQTLGLENTRGLPEVAAGVVELARCQANGWQYIRA